MLSKSNTQERQDHPWPEEFHAYIKRLYRLFPLQIQDAYRQVDG